MYFLVHFCNQNGQHQKFSKIAKNAFFSKKLFFLISFEGVIDVWKSSKNGLESVQNMFLSRIWHLNSFRTIFWKIEKNRFWKIFFGPCINKIGRKSIFRPNFGQILFWTAKTHLCPPPKNFLQNKSILFDFYHKICQNRPFWLKSNISHKCCFCCFCCFFGYHDVVFQKVWN